ncbi:hypothetical protein DPMN_030284 [Dreissena polymorpha]|uniref:Uncharacterized protein n=1 Tax=Dreissena polymorpha TaxID=45954 RepID=A0A9D4M0L2_DREPO|nr:hypothetical protein DPMN_030284 [Dreissena polymorpha]
MVNGRTNDGTDERMTECMAEIIDGRKSKRENQQLSERVNDRVICRMRGQTSARKNV